MSVPKEEERDTKESHLQNIILNDYTLKLSKSEDHFFMRMEKDAGLC